MFQENKARQIFRKAIFSYPLIRTHTNVRFSENLACFVFLKHPFWDSPFGLTTDDKSLWWSALREIAEEPVYQSMKNTFFGGLERELVPRSNMLHRAEWSGLNGKRSWKDAKNYLLETWFLRQVWKLTVETFFNKLVIILYFVFRVCLARMIWDDAIGFHVLL